MKVKNDTLEIDFEGKALAIHHWYENIHILNDFLLAAWFLVGSILFFYAHSVHLATWLFVLGSAQMMVGPLIRVAHKVHMRMLYQQQ